MRSFTVSEKSFSLFSTCFLRQHDYYCDYECMLTGDIAAGCKLLRNRFESKDREWASYTCVLGFHVMGENFNTFWPFVAVVASNQGAVISWSQSMMTVAVVFQVCGWRAPTAPTSTPCVALTVRGWWLWLMTSVKSTSSSTRVLNLRYRSYTVGHTHFIGPPFCLQWLPLRAEKMLFFKCFLSLKRKTEHKVAIYRLRKMVKSNWGKKGSDEMYVE